MFWRGYLWSYSTPGHTQKFVEANRFLKQATWWTIDQGALICSSGTCHGLASRGRVKISSTSSSSRERINEVAISVEPRMEEHVVVFLLLVAGLVVVVVVIGVVVVGVVGVVGVVAVVGVVGVFGAVGVVAVVVAVGSGLFIVELIMVSRCVSAHFWSSPVRKPVLISFPAICLVEQSEMIRVPKARICFLRNQELIDLSGRTRLKKNRKTKENIIYLQAVHPSIFLHLQKRLFSV